METTVKLIMFCVACYVGYKSTISEPKSPPVMGLRMLLSLFGIYFLSSIQLTDGASVKDLAFLGLVLLLYSKAYSSASSKQDSNTIILSSIGALNAAGVYAVFQILAMAAHLI